MNHYKIAFFGTPHFSVPILDSLRKHFDIAVVVSQPDKPVGKGLHLSPSPVSRFALANQLPLLRPSSLSKAKFEQEIRDFNVDLAVVVAYGKILPSWILVWPKHGAVNIHGSILPEHRGASPITSAILSGQDSTGLTLIKMNEQMDEGDIIDTAHMPISPEDTTASLSEKMSRLASEWAPGVIKNYIAGNISLAPQDHSRATYSKILDKSDGYIEINNPPQHLDRLVRAYHPWPGTWTLFRGKRVKILPGRQVQMEGKKPTLLEDFLHGYPEFPLSEW